MWGAGAAGRTASVPTLVGSCQARGLCAHSSRRLPATWPLCPLQRAVAGHAASVATPAGGRQARGLCGHSSRWLLGAQPPCPLQQAVAGRTAHSSGWSLGAQPLCPLHQAALKQSYLPEGADSGHSRRLEGPEGPERQVPRPCRALTMAPVTALRCSCEGGSSCFPWARPPVGHCPPSPLPVPSRGGGSILLLCTWGLS